MHPDDVSICAYLRSCPGEFVSWKQIARRAASKRRYEREPDWATVPLTRLVEGGLLETDGSGHYRLPPPKPKSKPHKWVSPQMRRILEQSGKVFDLGEIDDEPPP